MNILKYCPNCNMVYFTAMADCLTCRSNYKLNYKLEIIPSPQTETNKQ